MARIVEGTKFIGRAGGLTGYKRRGSDEIIIRKSSGVSGKKVKQSKRFAMTRRYNAEFGGRASTSRLVMLGFWRLKQLADYNIAGPINALLLHAQKLDTVSDLGMRGVLLSKIPGLLDGFSFNKKSPFDSILRNPLTYTLSKETLSASINLPAMVPGINFVAPQSYSMYRIVAMLSEVPDMVHTPHGYKPVNKNTHIGIAEAETPWYPVLTGSAPVTLDLKILSSQHSGQPCSIMLSIGISFGVMENATIVKQVKHAGAAKVMVVV